MIEKGPTFPRTTCPFPPRAHTNGPLYEHLDPLALPTSELAECSACTLSLCVPKPLSIPWSAVFPFVSGNLQISFWFSPTPRDRATYPCSNNTPGVFVPLPLFVVPFLKDILKQLCPFFKDSSVAFPLDRHTRIFRPRIHAVQDPG